MKKKIIIFTNDYKNIINLRYDLIKFLKNYYNIETLIIDKKKNNLENIYYLNNNYKSFNILKDFKLLVEIFSFLKKKSPDLVINFTLKPSIYGTFISYLLGIKSMTVVTGLGSIYLNNFTKFFYLFIMKIVFYFNDIIIFQNKSDHKIFFKNFTKSKIIKGSGFDKDKFKYLKDNNKNKLKFLMVSRPIKDKGLLEFLEAAKLLKKRYGKKIDFYLMTSKDKSIFSFSDEKISKYKKFIKILSFSKKKYIRYLRLVNFFVLPSYREGFSKTLLEASSAGKLVLATNVPGCRDIVINKKTGILFSKKSTKSLITAINYVISLSNQQRTRISFEASLRVNKNFSNKKINMEYLRVVDKLI